MPVAKVALRAATAALAAAALHVRPLAPYPQ